MVNSRPFQRVGSISNAHVGRDFEQLAQNFFNESGLDLDKRVSVPVGVNGKEKEHAFDLGCKEKKVLVECKSHKWTTPNDNVPTAKLTAWNEAMYYFLASPNGYRKILFVLKHYSAKRGETLANYYVRTYFHLIPVGVEIWEYDETVKIAEKLLLNKGLNHTG